MSRPTSDIAFTPTVKAVQERMGSRKGYAAMEQRGGWQSAISADLAAFIAERDTFFLGTTSSEGHPYVQHRGGPPGFLKVLGERSLGFADYRGNRQYISVGNLEDNERAFIFLIDFANRRRIKLWGRARVVEDPVICALVSEADDPAAERAFLFDIEAWDINCPKHITPRFTEEEVAERTRALTERIAELEALIAARCPAS